MRRLLYLAASFAVVYTVGHWVGFARGEKYGLYKRPTAKLRIGESLPFRTAPEDRYVADFRGPSRPAR